MRGGGGEGGGGRVGYHIILDERGVGGRALRLHGFPSLIFWGWSPFAPLRRVYKSKRKEGGSEILSAWRHEGGEGGEGREEREKEERTRQDRDREPLFGSLPYLETAPLVMPSPVWAKATLHYQSLRSSFRLIRNWLVAHDELPG